MNLANERPFSPMSNAGQVGGKRGDVLPRPALSEQPHCLGRCLPAPAARTSDPGQGGGRPEAEDGAVLGSDPRGLVSPEDGAPKVHTQAFPDAIL